MSANFAEMTIEEIKAYFSLIACQNYNQVRDYIFLHFLNSKEVVRKSTLLKRIFDRYNGSFKAETIATVIKDYVNMGVLFEVENGCLKIGMQEDWEIRDAKILASR